MQIHELSYQIRLEEVYVFEINLADVEAYFNIVWLLLKAGYYSAERYGLDKQNMLTDYSIYEKKREFAGYLTKYNEYFPAAYEDCLHDLQTFLGIQ
jgi:hypothetical protein